MSSTDSNAGSQDLTINNSNNSTNTNNNNNSGHPSQDADHSLIITSINDNNSNSGLLSSDTPGLSTTSSTNNSASSSPRSVVRKRQRLTSSRVISALDGYPAGSSSATSSASGGSVDKRSTLGPLLADRISSLSSDFHCPICLSLIKEVFMTRCGHSFCYSCIVQHLRDKQDCPVCRGALTRDQIFPNFSLNNIFERSAGLLDDVDVAEPRSKSRHDILNQNDYTPEEIDNMLSTLKAKKRKLEADSKQVELEVILYFLRNTRAEKQEAKRRLEAQIECLDEDVRKAEKKLDVLKQYSGFQAVTRNIEDEEEELLDGAGVLGGVQVPNEVSEEEDEAVPPQTGSKRSHSQLERETSGDEKIAGRVTPEANMQMLKISKQVNFNKKRVAEHFEDLQRCYFDFSLASDTRRESGLSSFCSTISKFTKFSHFEHVNTLRYGDIYNTSSIVSSMEFDRDDEYFATAGVTKKIKIFEYGCIEKSGLAGTSLRDDDPTETYEAGSSLLRPSRYSSNKKPITSVLHYPVREMTCRSKISCLSWNSYIKSQIASSDYEGIVSLWDAQTGVNTLNYDEHEKRAWSVDFSRTDPTRLASGSDDTKVKIWSTNHKASVCTIVSKANICCVKFNPESSNHIAFGSADHHIHYYDLRKASEPLFVFKGHRKAVSYVKFLSRDELVSASTDSTLKLWSTQRMTCARTFVGHVNEKNFVGLSASGDWISCGSENNAVYTYYKELRDPVITVKFGNSNPVTGEDTADEDPSQFVSSVCWKKNLSNNILLAANSTGVIKVLELV